MPPNAAFVIHCFAPLTCQPSPSGSARVTSAPASDPEPGSVSAKQPTPSPRASGGTNRDRCSSVPNWSSGSVHAEVCTATVTPTPASARDSSSSTRMYETKSAPAPPYSSGTQTPISPSVAQLREQLSRKSVCPVPLRRMRLDLRGRELARQRLDLLLLRRQLEVHGGQTIRMRLAAILLGLLALTACGGHKTRLADGGRARLERRPRPKRQRSRGTLFADGAQVIQNGVLTDSPTHAAAVALERAAPVRRRDHLARTARARNSDRWRSSS